MVWAGECLVYLPSSQQGFGCPFGELKDSHERCQGSDYLQLKVRSLAFEA